MEIFPFLSNPLTITARAKNSQPPASLLKYPINNNKHGIPVTVHGCCTHGPTTSNSRIQIPPPFFQTVFGASKPPWQYFATFSAAQTAKRAAYAPHTPPRSWRNSRQNAARWPALSTKTRPVSAVTTIPPRKRKSNNSPWRLASGKILQ